MRHVGRKRPVSVPVAFLCLQHRAVSRTFKAALGITVQNGWPKLEEAEVGGDEVEQHVTQYEDCVNVNAV